MDGKTTANSALAYMAGRRTNNQLQIAYHLLLQRDRTLLSCKTINVHLYIYSALVLGRRIKECRHIANALTLCVIMAQPQFLKAMGSNYPKKFDRSDLHQEQKAILADFFQRRRFFDAYLVENNIPRFTCPGCGFPTLTVRGGYEICSVCDWEDDNQDDDEADEIWGGPNSTLSLTENRINIGEELIERIKKSGGKLKDDPKAILDVLSHHWPSLDELIEKSTD